MRLFIIIIIISLQSIGIQGALAQLVLPKLRTHPVHRLVVDRSGTRRLKLPAWRTPLTTVVFAGQLLTDPTEEEESLAEASVSVVLDSEKGTLLMLDKAGGGALGLDIIDECIARTRARIPDIAKALSSITDSPTD